ncbi:FixJ family two-component response regulator [Neorhizobium galegae]|uniref:response regulator transcription factor n=2 Tax=Neorhizobium galegae TaxID=399 RepID=UPI001AE9BFC0|nr:response regulator transcription factor [Neorhizobium galegae]MBP2558131.1 FixJ family two-component response regulator [Neorhizobium galegae]MDQ0136921.1 FixJ family two-component response regulator [Neorhizobium galegae]
MTETNSRNKMKQIPAGPVVHILDDDESMREALTDLLQSMQISSRAFATTQAFLESYRRDQPGCILLDVRLPGVSGLDFQGHLERLGNHMPIIFMTGFGDIPMSVRAMKAGAVDFLTKPFRDQDILDAVTVALDKDAQRRRESAASDAVAALAATLTPREREVMAAVVQGLMNKQIAFNLGISEITVKLHRGNVMRKMDARSVADLVRKTELLDEAGIVPTP